MKTIISITHSADDDLGLPEPRRWWENKNWRFFWTAQTNSWGWSSIWCTTKRKQNSVEDFTAKFSTGAGKHAHVTFFFCWPFHFQAFSRICSYLGGNDPVVCKPLRNIMAVLWELVCYVNCACVTLMGRVEALEEMRRDGSVSVTDRQARDITTAL